MGVVGTIIGIGAGLIGAIGDKKEGDRAEEQGRKNAEMEAESTAKQLELTAQEQKYQKSLAKARSAATGVAGGTTDIYLEAMETAGKKELDWIEKVGASRYENELAKGRSAKAGAMSGFWGNIGMVGKLGASLWG